MAERRLQDCVDRLRQRLAWIDGLAAICWGCLALVGIMLVAAWLDLLWELPPGGRIAAWCVASAAAAVLAGRLIGQLLGKLKSAQVARQLDRAAGGTGEIVSGWDLATGSAGPQNSELTAGLAQLAIASATRTANGASLNAAAPARPLRVAGTTVGLSLGFLILLALALPSLSNTQWLRFTRPFADVPNYSGIQFEIDPGNAQVIYGQGLDVRATISNSDAGRVELMVAAEGGGVSQSVPMFPEGEGKWRATVARVVEPLSYHVAANRGRSLKYRIAVITTPKLEAVRFRITPPAYTRDAPYDGPLPKQGIVALPGTKVEIRAKSNRPLSGGAVQLESETQPQAITLLPSADAADEVRGEFTVTAGGKFTLQVTDVDGTNSQEPFAGTITVLADQRPFVRMMQPRAQSFATPTAALPVTVAAEDDYGITEVQLYRNLNESRSLPMNFEVQKIPLRRHNGQVYLPLQRYQLQPGDTIKLYGRVLDNDPAGSKGAESSVVTVQIISQDEFETMLRVKQGLEVFLSKYRQAERRLERLAAEIEKLREDLEKEPADSPVAKELRERLEKLAGEMEKEASAIEASADHELPYDLDRQLSDKLKELAEALREAGKQTKSLAGDSQVRSQEMAEKLKKLAAELGAKRASFEEETLIPLEHFAKVFPLIENQSRFIELVAVQVDLADRLSALKGKDNVDDPAIKARMRDLEAEQLRNREALHDLLEKIEADAEELPDELQFARLWETARAFVREVRASGAAEEMSEAEAGLAEFSGTRGHQHAREAAEILKKFIAQCEGVMGEGDSCLVFQPTLSQCLGNTVSQMLAEAGLGKTGSGPGQGSGGGFSSRRSTLNNVGLYGGLPGQAGGDGGEGRYGNGQEGSGNFAGGSTGGDPNLVESAVAGSATGSASGAVPVRYRQRVGQYIERVNQEVHDE